ncbi:MAG: helix-turn-helix domain-containing protein [Deltaproteobacteria bacterium]|nr:MAG: helix-turn-helix domain-containing protein [Deltaproteobacteria bacterium]
MAEDAEKGTGTLSRADADGRRAYSVHETAARLGVSVGLIAKAIRNGRLPSVKLGDRRLIPVDAVEELLAQARVRAASTSETSSN